MYLSNRDYTAFFLGLAVGIGGIASYGLVDNFISQGSNSTNQSNARNTSNKKTDLKDKIPTLKIPLPVSRDIAFSEVKSVYDFYKYISQAGWDVYYVDHRFNSAGNSEIEYVSVGKVNPDKVASPAVFKSLMLDNVDLVDYWKVRANNYTEYSGAEKMKVHQEHVESLFSEEWKSSDNPKCLEKSGLVSYPAELFSKALVGNNVNPSAMSLQLRTDGKVLIEYGC